MTEEQTKSLVTTLTDLGVCPGPNTDSMMLCLTDDPNGGSTDEELWFIGWNVQHACWTAACIIWRNDGLDEEDKAYRWLNGEWLEVEFQGW